MLVVLMVAAAMAQSPEYSRCIAGIDNGAMVKSQMLDCATADMDRADGALNRTYKAVMATLPPRRRAGLVTAERGWIKARRARCLAAARDDVPSPEINRMLCLVRETDARTAALRAMR